MKNEDAGRPIDGFGRLPGGKGSSYHMGEESPILPEGFPAGALELTVWVWYD
jgi:hypothetical protein